MATTSTSKRWRLESIKIRNFRGISKEHKFQFDGKCAILSGHNGVGKSTVTQSLQWTLFGKFPPNVLQNISYDKFLAPVKGKKKAYFGEVTFRRGRERLSICRDEAEGSFTLTHGSDEYHNNEAEQKRDELLGLDMDTFARAVVLHQSRIRGLLVDEPRERNKALDRLLGMDALEQFQLIINPKLFTDAADEWRAKIAREEAHYETHEDVLKGQRDETQRRARELSFTNKDFNVAGLKKSYGGIRIELAELGKKYKVELDKMPACNTVEDAKKISKAFKQALKTIRVESELHKRLTPVETKLSQCKSLKKLWDEALKERNRTKTGLKELALKLGEKDSLKKKLSNLENKISKQKKDLKTTDELRQLLYDAQQHITDEKPEKCPICEKEISKSRALDKDLEKRIKALSTKTIIDKEAKLETLESQLSILFSDLTSYEESEELVAEAQKQLGKHRKSIVKTLGGTGIAENKINMRLKEAITKNEAKHKKLSKGIETMEQDLENIVLKEGSIREGLLPVLLKREEIKSFEKEWKEAKKAHTDDRTKVQNLDNLAQQFLILRQAIIDAKDKLATKSLSKARPRAQELYKTLVHHTLFDTLTIKTDQKPKKMDYAFEVSVGSDSKTSREAKLVLSDGQLTAAALGLFFALAESTIHGMDMLYIDDPTQNLDLPSKESMAEVVADLAKRKQVIVSTQDEDFENFLESEGFKESAITFNFKKWDGNPSMKTEPPGGQES